MPFAAEEEACSVTCWLGRRRPQWRHKMSIMATQYATVQPCVRINTPETQSTLLEQEIATDTVFVVHSEGVTGMRYHFMPCAHGRGLNDIGQLLSCLILSPDVACDGSLPGLRARSVRVVPSGLTCNESRRTVRPASGCMLSSVITCGWSRLGLRGMSARVDSFDLTFNGSRPAIRVMSGRVVPTGLVWIEASCFVQSYMWITAVSTWHDGAGDFVRYYRRWVATGSSWSVGAGRFVRCDMRRVAARSSYPVGSTGFIRSYTGWMAAFSSWHVATGGWIISTVVDMLAPST